MRVTVVKVNENGDLAVSMTCADCPQAKFGSLREGPHEVADIPRRTAEMVDSVQRGHRIDVTWDRARRLAERAPPGTPWTIAGAGVDDVVGGQHEAGRDHSTEPESV